MSFFLSRRTAGVLSFAALMAACGGGGGGSSSPAAPAAPAAPLVQVVTYNVGGTVSGMTAGLVLQNNAADDLMLMANGNFDFASGVAAGAAYQITVRANPPFQTCTVSNGTGTMGSADVTNIGVTCADGVMVRTVAGSSPGNVNGNGTNARFNGPLAVAVDADGNLLVTDSSNNSLRKITPTGDVTTLASGLNRPFGVTVSQGRIFVTSEGGSKLLEVHPVTGVVTEPVLDTLLDRPRGIVADTAGNLYVSGYGQLIQKITPSGVVTTLAGNGAIGTANGQGTAASFYNPANLTIDAFGNVYVADQNGPTIRKITPTGLVTTLAGSGGMGAADGPGATATFWEPVGIAMGIDGMVYMSDSAGQKIRRIAADGTVSSIAGLSLTSGTADGNASTARFDYPAGMAFDALGNLYVLDANSNRVRKLSGS